jgi:hypothetical protein
MRSNLSGSAISLANDGKQACPAKPLMSKPKLRGTFSQFSIPHVVGIGSQSEPGAEGLMRESAMTEKMRMKVETTEMREVKERRRRGRKTVGRMLKGERANREEAGKVRREHQRGRSCMGRRAMWREKDEGRT